MSTQSPELRLRLQAVSRRVKAARIDIARGKAVELSELKDEVEAVCESLRLATVQVDREAAATEINAILQDLDALERELTAQHEQINQDDGASG